MSRSPFNGPRAPPELSGRESHDCSTPGRVLLVLADLISSRSEYPGPLQGIDVMGYLAQQHGQS